MSRPHLPENLEMIAKSDTFADVRHRWNTNEEIASILICFDKHEEWLSKEVKIRPRSGSMLLYSRKRVRYRRDGFCWKKRKDGKTTREDHMKLKVQGTECIYGCYVHSAVLPTFHRRCYWLLQNPDVVLVHYLNVPFSDDNKVISPALSFADSRKEWTREELISELKPMFFSESDSDLSEEMQLPETQTIDSLIQQLMARQRAKIRALEEASESHFATRVPSNRERQYNGKNALLVKQLADDPDGKKDTLSPTACLVTSPALTATVATTTRPTNVQLLQINPTKTTTAPSAVLNSPNQSLIFNLSHLQNGNSILILNSPMASGRAVGSLTREPLKSRSYVTSASAASAPVTLMYSRSSATQAAPGFPSPRLTADVSKIRSIPAASGDVSEGSNPENLMNVETLNGNTEVTSAASSSQAEAWDASPSSATESGSENGEKMRNGFLLPAAENADWDASFSSNCEPGVQANHPALNCSTASASASRPSSQEHSMSPATRSESHNNCDADSMDFMDNGLSTSAEDLFNLETFDMLTDEMTDNFSGLDDLSTLVPSSFRGPQLFSAPNDNDRNNNNQQADHGQRSHTGPDFAVANPHITDYSPEWSYPDGGMKVLVAGPWYSSNSQYSIIFDGISVATSLVQNGVLRCFSPAHEPGFVSLQVAMDGIPISNSVIFEYREATDTPTHAAENYFNVDDNVFKFCLMERLELLESHVSSGNKKEKRTAKTFEQRLISSCEHVMYSPWLPCNVTAVTSQSLRRGSSRVDMSLVHLAAALGYSDLIRHLITWRKENPSIILEVEVDAFSCDHNECTPLMWSIARGHRDTTVQLLRWNKGAINLCNKQGVSPLQVARANGHHQLADQVEQLLKDLLAGTEATLSPVPEMRVPHKPADQKDDGPDACCMQSRVCCIHSGCLHPRPSTRTKPLSRETSVDPAFDLGFTSADDSEEEEDGLDTSGDVSGSGLSSQRSSFDANDSSESLLDTNEQVLSFAEHIIAAMPDRIKSDSAETSTCDWSRKQRDADAEAKSERSSPGMQASKGLVAEELIFEFAELSYRSHVTPTSSPASSSCLQSPGSCNTESPSPPPTAEDLCEFFGAGRVMQKEFSSLTLSDQEQRELYDAARTIQKAYRVYKGRKRQEEEKERLAAVLIQSYYRKYKQYVYYKQMTRAAQVIQNQFRSYCSKRFKKGSSCGDSSCSSAYENSSFSSASSSLSHSSASLILDHGSLLALHNTEQTRIDCPAGVKRTYSQRRQEQAARQILQFLRQSKNNWDFDSMASERTCSRIRNRRHDKIGGSCVSVTNSDQSI